MVIKFPSVFCNAFLWNIDGIQGFCFLKQQNHVTSALLVNPASQIPYQWVSLAAVAKLTGEYINDHNVADTFTSRWEAFLNVDIFTLLLQVHVGGNDNVHLRVYQSLSLTGTGPELISIKEFKTHDDEIEYFEWQSLKEASPCLSIQQLVHWGGTKSNTVIIMCDVLPIMINIYTN